MCPKFMKIREMQRTGHGGFQRGKKGKKSQKVPSGGGLHTSSEKRGVFDFYHVFIRPSYRWRVKLFWKKRHRKTEIARGC